MVSVRALKISKLMTAQSKDTVEYQDKSLHSKIHSSMTTLMFSIKIFISKYQCVLPTYHMLMVKNVLALQMIHFQQ